jgi:hypothetical protein
MALGRCLRMPTARTKSAAEPETKIGDFIIKPWDAQRVYIEDKTTQGGTFPKREVEKILHRSDAARALRKYYDANF